MAPPDDFARMKQIETELRRMTKVFMDGADPIVIRDLAGRIVDANSEVERVFGWSRQELLGRPAKELLPPEWQDLAELNMARCLAGEAVRNVEGAIPSKSGKLVPILSTAFPLTDENNQPVAIANIVKDITRLKQVSTRLDQRNRELQHFVSAVSHDLGEPLRAIQGFVQLLRDGYQDQLGDEAREWIQFVIDGVKRMQILIDDLLDYSRLESQTITFKTVDVNKVMSEALANLHASIVDSGAVVTCDQLPTVVGNASQLLQLLQNLIGNAIKYRSKQRPTVHVGAKRADDGWEIAVRDNGIGIPPGQHERIFDIFRRLHSREQIPGSGVGLATCRVIVERHGGRIWVESEAGQGSTFHFTFPDENAASKDGSEEQ
jgi:PAS domain S-box-containing protein